MHIKFEEVIGENKNFWKELRELGLLRSSRVELHGFTTEEIKSYFASISISPNEEYSYAHNIINSASTNGFSFKPVTVNDVILAVSHFKSQAKGESILAKALPSIAPQLVCLFNESIAQGIFPTAWKNAQIIALKKVAVPSSPSDFRPISLLCFLSKVLEKLAHDQIVEHFRGSGALDPFQTGFKKHQSTQTALLKLTDDIRMGRDKKLVTILLQFDFSKAFDTISPSKLLHKLKDLGFSKSALLWVHSYITGRSQCVISNSTTSESRETNLGVPQGSVLGPLLFCLYINDLKHLSNVTAVPRLLYADDLQIYIQVTLKKLYEGCSRADLDVGELELSPVKCQQDQSNYFWI